MKKHASNTAPTPTIPPKTGRKSQDKAPTTSIYTSFINFDLKNLIIQKLKHADIPFWSAFFVLLTTLSLIFLYFGTHFIFGDHDWKYIKGGVPLDSGLFEGRFTQFIPINLLTFGEILPIINNIIGFISYSLGISLLARYWQIPHTKKDYIIFALFAGITPYILSFMYFAFLVIPVLGWSAFIIGSLLISASQTKFFSPKGIISAILYAFALGGYPPVINLFATALIIRLLITSLNGQTTVKELIKFGIINASNFALGLIIYKLCLMYFTHTGAINPNYYNLQTTPLNEWANKFLLTLKNSILQFSATLPFITAPYKIATGIITLCSVYTVVNTIRTTHTPKLFLLILPLTFLAPLCTFFLSTSIAETQFSPRIDFFGLAYLYAGMLALILHTSNGLIKNTCYIAVICSIYFSTTSLFEASKVWKLGFDNELKLYNRISKRFTSNSMFNPNSKYIMVQDNSINSLRARYYHDSYRYKSDDLLDISYVPGMNSAVMWNFYSDPEFADKPAYVYRFTPDDTAKLAIKNAKAWPNPESTAIGGYWIMFFLSEDSIPVLHKRYLH